MPGCRWVSAAALLALAGCEAGPPPASTWPPADYYVEVRHQKAGLDQRVGLTALTSGQRLDELQRLADEPGQQERERRRRRDAQQPDRDLPAVGLQHPEDPAEQLHRRLLR